jgi:hypothetical protein
MCLAFHDPQLEPLPYSVGDSAVQRESGTSLWGYIERGFGEFFRAVHFTLERFSVTPGVCRS